MSPRRPGKSDQLPRAQARKLAAHEYAAYLQERNAACKDGFYWIGRQALKQLPTVKRIQNAPRAVQAEFLMLGIRRALKGYKPPTDEYIVWTGSAAEGRREIAMEGPALLLGRSLPLRPQDLEVLAYAQTSHLLSRGNSSLGGLLRTIQCALNGTRPEGRLRSRLTEWKRKFSVHYGSDFAALRARLDDILNGKESAAETEPTTADDTRARNNSRDSTAVVRTPTHAITLLVKAADEVWQLVPAGRPLRIKRSIPASVFKTLSPQVARDALVRITQALIGEFGSNKDHPARYATLRPGFAKARSLAPEFSQAFLALFERLHSCSDSQLVKLFEPLYVGWRKRAAADKLIETFHLAQLDRPQLFAMFRAAMESANQRTDCPTWGDSFAPIEDEAEGPQPLILLPGDAWANTAMSALKEVDKPTRAAWIRLLSHCDSVEWSRPSTKWLTGAAALTTAAPNFSATLSDWLSLVGKRGTRTQNLWGWPPDPTYLRHRNQRTLRALIWAATTAPTPELAAAIGDAAVACDQKVLRLGPRSEIVRNAAIAALAEMPASISGPQITKVNLLSRYKTSRKKSKAALESAAHEQQLSVEEFMELAVPTYDFDKNHQTKRAGGTTFRITGGNRIQVDPTPETKPREAAEIERLLAAHRVRLERLLISDRSWPVKTWRERYGDHPLLSFMSRRLIWTAGTATVPVASFMFHHNSFIDPAGKPISLPDSAIIRPWHPAAQNPDHVFAWRNALESREIIQPFKQAHREIYLLTDAERKTSTYSNRFAAHILRGPQFRALMRERGWSGDPVIAFDTSNTPACLELPAHNLTAFFHTDPGGEDADDRGFFPRVYSDRVEFKRDGALVNLSDIPPLIFTEVMRDIDLFVGVASIGSNPHWSEGGPDGRFRDYWWQYGFGELGISGAARREVLERLLPRLTIANACTLQDRFLQVRGRRRTYKIHLGSGNILIEPNDQYLCIVPADAHPTIHLPFEGDRTLSIILSKAFMLAEDDKITDTSITAQINRSRS